MLIYILPATCQGLTGTCETGVNIMSSLLSLYVLNS